VKAILALIFAIAASAQTPPDFEVASVKQSGLIEHLTCGQFLPGGKFNVSGCRLIYIVAQAYDLHYYQVVDAPNWAAEGDSSRFDIQAEAGDGASKDQIRLMLRNLLADRFQLRFHREMRGLSALALVVGGNRAKLQVARENGKPRGSGAIELVASGWIRGTNIFPSFLADALSGQLSLPVVDKTNITDAIDFNLQWAPDEKAEDLHPSIFTAVQEQLGLRLEPLKAPIEVLVVDHVEKPSAN
jgi:uncharacterized protein (TIGR03435 family)